MVTFVAGSFAFALMWGSLVTPRALDSRGLATTFALGFATILVLVELSAFGPPVGLLWFLTGFGLSVLANLTWRRYLERRVRIKRL